MTDLNKAKFATGINKLDLIRKMPLTPASPLTPAHPKPIAISEPIPDMQQDAKPSSEISAPASNLSPPAKAEAARGSRKHSHDASAYLPKAPIDSAGKLQLDDKKHLASHAFTFAFSIHHAARALHLASVIGCKIDDIITRIARSFHTDQLDTTIEVIQPRVGSGKRILLKIDQNTIDLVRANRDPLGVRSDGFLLRAPVIAALDRIAEQVLQALEEHYEN